MISATIKICPDITNDYYDSTPLILSDSTEDIIPSTSSAPPCIPSAPIPFISAGFARAMKQKLLLIRCASINQRYINILLRICQYEIQNAKCKMRKNAECRMQNAELRRFLSPQGSKNSIKLYIRLLNPSVKYI